MRLDQEELSDRLWDNLYYMRNHYGIVQWGRPVAIDNDHVSFDDIECNHGCRCGRSYGFIVEIRSNLRKWRLAIIPVGCCWHRWYIRLLHRWCIDTSWLFKRILLHRRNSLTPNQCLCVFLGQETRRWHKRHRPHELLQENQTQLRDDQARLQDQWTISLFHILHHLRRGCTEVWWLHVLLPDRRVRCWL